jgi:hypothetical protein
VYVCVVVGRYVGGLASGVRHNVKSLQHLIAFAIIMEYERCEVVTMVLSMFKVIWEETLLLGVSPGAQNCIYETLCNVQGGVMYNIIIISVVYSLDTT